MITIKKMHDKRTTYLGVISEKLNIPKEVLRWHIDKYAEDDGIRLGESYFPSGWTYWLTLPAFLWLASQVHCKDYAAITEITEALCGVPENDAKECAAAQKLADAVKKMAEIEEALKLSQEVVRDLMTEITDEAKKSSEKGNDSEEDNIPKADAAEKPEKAPAKKKQRNKGLNDPALPPLEKAEQEWMEDITDLVAMKAKQIGIMGAKLLQTAYRVMNRNYGIVFEQVRKDFLYDHDLPQETRMTTVRLISYHENLRSILWGIIGNIEDYIQKKAG